MILILERLQYFAHPIVRYAMIVGVLTALSASLLGVPLVLKRYSFIGDGLSHVAFGALAVASALRMAGNLLFVMPVTVLFAILLLRLGQNAKIKGDAAIAMLSVGSLAVGYLLMNLFSVSPNLSGDVCTTLFGATSILTLARGDVYLCLAMSLGVLAFFVLFYNRIFAVTFDENFARATGIRAGLYNLLLAVVTAVVIVLAMNYVGSLLVSALVVFPALSAMRLFASFRSVMLCSVVVAVVCAAVGMVVAVVAGTPVGATIVVANILVFGLFSFARLFVRGRA